MEQYAISPRDCNRVIQTALKHFEVERLFIRWVGSQGGGTEVNEVIRGRRLAVGHRQNGFMFSIDGVNQFFFRFTKSVGFTWGKKWTFAYERYQSRGGDTDVIWMASGGYPYPGAPYTGPDDPRLPEPRSTVLRSANDGHLAEITFRGKIPIIKSGRKMSGTRDYYIIDTSRLPKPPRS